MITTQCAVFEFHASDKVNITCVCLLAYNYEHFQSSGDGNFVAKYNKG